MTPFLLLVGYCVFFLITVHQPIVYANLVVGIVIGFLIIFADRILNAYYLEPRAEFNVLLREHIRRRSLKGVLQLLYHAEGLQHGLITRSIMFLIAFAALTIFVLTSTGSILGVGVILGMGLRYSIDMWGLMNKPEVFRNEFLSGIKHDFSPQDIRRITFGWIVGFVIISTIVLAA